MHRKSNRVLLTLGAALGAGIFAIILGLAPWIVIGLMAIVCLGVLLPD